MTVTESQRCDGGHRMVMLKGAKEDLTVTSKGK